MTPIQGTIFAVVFILAMAVPTSAWASIPVSCGDTLDIPGGQYRLYGDLNCSDPAISPISITANDVHFDLGGFTITGPGPFQPSIGIDVFGVTGAHIQGGQIKAFRNGIDMFLSSNSHVNGMTLNGNFTGIAITFGDDNKINGNNCTENLNRAISLFASNLNRIHGNVMTLNRSGLTLFACDDNVITSNIVSDYRGDPLDGFTSIGISLIFSSGNRLLGNMANRHEAGIVVEGGQDNLIQGNYAIENLFAGISTGSRISVGPGTRIQGNTALGNTYGGTFPPSLPRPPIPRDLLDFDLFYKNDSQVQWKSNAFETDSEGDGPGAGWIQ